MTLVCTTVIVLAGLLDRSDAKRRLVACASGVTTPADLQAQPLRGGPLLADCCVVRQSLYIGMASSSLLALGQNRLRHGSAN